MGRGAVIASLLVLLLPSIHSSVSDSPADKNRVALEIIIGGGGGGGGGGYPYPRCPPSSQNRPPPPSPVVPAPKPLNPAPPPTSISPLVVEASKTIQSFGKTIVSDPQGVTKTWMGSDVCGGKYKGFICDRYPNGGLSAVAGVSFNGFGFGGRSGRLSLAGIMIQQLAFFHANSNNFTGSVPAVIKDIPFLYEFDVSNNKLSGGFPTEVLAARNLTYIDLRFNFFSGAVPPQAFELDLDVLFLNNNQFGGDIPANLGNTKARYLTLANNQFTGGIPRSIGRASRTLLEILLLGNRLSGCLPYEIADLGLLKLFDVRFNQVTGPVPRAFGCLKKLQVLNLECNLLYGTFPEEVCMLPRLTSLSVAFNYLTELGPECRKLVWRKKMDVQMNCVLGLPSQRSRAECNEFFSRRPPCSEERWRYTYLPCRLSSDPEGDPGEAPAPADAPVTYGALTPDWT